MQLGGGLVVKHRDQDGKTVWEFDDGGGADHIPIQAQLTALRKPALTRADIPAFFSDFAYMPAASGIDANLLVLLHGLGDTCRNFLSFGTGMQLPQTAVLALQPSLELPEGLGATWFEVLDEATGEFVDPQQALLNERVLETPVAAFDEMWGRLQARGWTAQEVLVLGHGQGGTVALLAGLRGAVNAAVSIGGPLLQSRTAANAHIAPTRIFLAAPPSLRAQMQRDCKMLKGAHVAAEVQLLQHEFPRTKAEMEPIMKFLSAVLKKRMPTLEQLADSIL